MYKKNYQCLIITDNFLPAEYANTFISAFENDKQLTNNFHLHIVHASNSFIKTKAQRLFFKTKRKKNELTGKREKNSFSSITISQNENVAEKINFFFTDKSFFAILNLSSIDLGNALQDYSEQGVWKFVFGNQFNPLNGLLQHYYLSKPVITVRLICTKDNRQFIYRKGVLRLLKYNPVKSFQIIQKEISTWLSYCLELTALKIISPDFSPLDFSIDYSEIDPQIFYFTKLKIIFNKLNHYFTLLFTKETWNAGYTEQTVEDLLQNGITKKITWLPDPFPESFYADPFAFESNGELNILFEDCSYSTGKGILSGYKISNKKIEKVTSLETDFHLSYPYILNFENKNYCIPECCASNELAIYEVNEKLQLINKKILIHDTDIVDPSLIFYKKKWWLFASLKHDSPNTKLYIWYADELFGNYVPHSVNPVKVDITGARPGGKLFFYGDNLYRPAQDSSTSYGDSLKLQKIVDLTVNEFKEETVVALSPKKNYPFTKGIHHLTVVNNFIVIDGKRTVLNFKLKSLKKLLK